MTSFVTRTATHLGVDRIFTSATATALYNNLLAAFEGNATAVAAGVQVQTAAIADGAVTAAKLNSAAFATQTQMEGFTSGVIVSPANIFYSPAAAKVWGNWNANGSLNASFNVSSITDNGAGDHTVHFGTSFSGGAANAFSAIARHDAAAGAGGALIMNYNGNVGLSSSFARFMTYDLNDQNTDGLNFHMIGFGDF